MKKNAIIIAGILFVAGASQAQQDSSDRYKSSSPLCEEHSLHQDDISADSSRRGGSLDARGYLQHENNNEIEGAPDALNPGKQADSSIRGGSIFAREREWNHDSEPSSGQLDHKRWMKADSSIRGGSLEARGSREAMKDSDQFQSSGNFQYGVDERRSDFGQGSSATSESDKGQGSVQGSANWNPDDDLLRDGLDAEAQSTLEYERNNDASASGAARSESGSATLDDVELDYEAKSDHPAFRDDLNSSERLEQNISGEFKLDKQGESPNSDFRSSTDDMELSPSDPNSLDTSYSSTSSTDIVHGQGDIEISTESDLSSDIERENREATGAAAGSESGQGSSSDVSDDNDLSSSFESNDPALRSLDPSYQENDPGSIYLNNRARGVGSLATGEFGGPARTELGRSMSDQDLAREVKGTLTRESTGTHGYELARNVQVSAENGEVTLKGTVPSEKDKQIIEIRASQMPGVNRVKNELTVTRDLIRQ